MASAVAAACGAWALVSLWPAGSAGASTHRAHCTDRAGPLTDPETNEGEPSVRVFQRARDRLIASWTSGAAVPAGNSTAQGSVVVSQRGPGGTWAPEVVSPDPSGSAWIDTAPGGPAYVSYVGLRGTQVMALVRRVLPGQPAGPESALPFPLSHPSLAVDQGRRQNDWLIVAGDGGLAGVALFSYDSGRSWSQPVKFPPQLDHANPPFPQAGPVTASGGGTTIVAWREEYYDDEDRIRTAIRAAPVNPATGTFGRAITLATMPYAASLGFGAQPFPSLAIVRNGVWEGRAYVVWPQAGDAVHAALRSSDVYLRHSDDGGKTWSPPVRANDDSRASAHHVYPSVAARPDGSALVAWLDSRDSQAQTPPEVTGLIYGAVADADGRRRANRKLTYCPSHTEDVGGAGAALGHYFNFDASVAGNPTLVFPAIRDRGGLSDVFLLEPPLAPPAPVRTPALPRS